MSEPRMVLHEAPGCGFVIYEPDEADLPRCASCGRVNPDWTSFVPKTELDEARAALRELVDALDSGDPPYSALLVGREAEAFDAVRAALPTSEGETNG